MTCKLSGFVEGLGWCSYGRFLVLCKQGSAQQGGCGRDKMGDGGRAVCATETSQVRRAEPRRKPIMCRD